MPTCAATAGDRESSIDHVVPRPAGDVFAGLRDGGLRTYRRGMRRSMNDDQLRSDPDTTAAASEPGVWRDEEELPLSELARAMATYSQDGQVDDLTGSDAGAEAEFGHEPAAATGDPDPGSESGRRFRPSPDGPSGVGRSGPN